jgi:hypothetical protein
MDDLDIIDNESNYGGTQKLPVFLKVLCILTFVGSGLGILGALIGFLVSDMSTKSYEMMQTIDNGGFDAIGFNIAEMIKWQKYMNIGNLVGSALCLTGALMMWKLKKVGFYLYLPGTIIPLIVTGIGMQYVLTGFMSGFGALSIVINGIFAAAFITMYGINFKHLR